MSEIWDQPVYVAQHCIRQTIRNAYATAILTYAAWMYIKWLMQSLRWHVFFSARTLLFAAWRSKRWGSGVARTASADQVPGHLDFGISPMPGVPPQGRRERRDAWGGGWGGWGGGCSRGWFRHLGRCGWPGLASWDWLQKELELPGSVVQTTSRWMLGWQLVAEPGGLLCFWLAQGAGGSPQFLRSIALRLPWPRRPGDNGLPAQVLGMCVL